MKNRKKKIEEGTELLLPVPYPYPPRPDPTPHKLLRRVRPPTPATHHPRLLRCSAPPPATHHLWLHHRRISLSWKCGILAGQTDREKLLGHPQPILF